MKIKDLVKSFFVAVILSTIVFACSDTSTNSVTNPTTGLSAITSTTFYINVTHTYPPGGCVLGTTCPVVGAEVNTSCGIKKTNQSGNADFTCSGSTISGTVKLRNGHVKMVTAAGFGTDVPFSGAGGGVIYVNMPSVPSYFWNYLQYWDSVSSNRFAVTLPVEVTARAVPTANVEGLCGVPASGCYIDASPTIIFTDSAYFNPPGGVNYWLSVAAHEFGHAVQMRAIEGYTCGSDLACNSWREGFAKFFESFIPGLVLPSGNYENMNSLPQGVLTNSTDSRVAAMLTDMVDSAGSADNSIGVDDDTITWPASYIRKIMQTCSTQVGGFIWTHIQSRIDQFVTCAQNTLTARSAVPAWDQNNWVQYTAYTDNDPEPSGWTAGKIQQLWLWNFYNQGSLP